MLNYRRAEIPGRFLKANTPQRNLMESESTADSVKPKTIMK